MTMQDFINLSLKTWKNKQLQMAIKPLYRYMNTSQKGKNSLSFLSTKFWGLNNIETLRNIGHNFES